MAASLFVVYVPHENLNETISQETGDRTNVTDGEAPQSKPEDDGSGKEILDHASETEADRSTSSSQGNDHVEENSSISSAKETSSVKETYHTAVDDGNAKFELPEPSKELQKVPEEEIPLIDSKDNIQTDPTPGETGCSDLKDGSEPVEKTTEVTSSRESLADFIEVGNSEQMLAAALKQLEIEDAVWVLAYDKSFYQVTFVAESSKTEQINRVLKNCGIGVPKGKPEENRHSSISVLPITIHHSGKALKKVESKSFDSAEDEVNAAEEFVKSIKSRLTVSQVVETIKAQANLTFDYVMLVILASLIASLGLVENSSVILVASMLISPLMGPILGGTFGFTIKNTELRNLGLKTATIGLLLCVLCGFLFGFICGPLHVNWGSSSSFPTPEMKARGMRHALWSGILIAIPSGAGVALSVLGGNAGSLVGVAISASLLPPAVNAGILWAYAIVSGIDPPDVMNTTVTGACASFLNNEYIPVYSCTMSAEAAVLGTVSLVLTLLNIICIFIMATVVLKIKEVAPHTSSSSAGNEFWKQDIKVARASYETMKGTSNLRTQLLKDYKEYKQAQKLTRSVDSIASDDEIYYEATEALEDIAHDVENDTHYQRVMAYLPRRPASLLRQLSDRPHQDSPPHDRYQKTIHNLTVRTPSCTPQHRHIGEIFTMKEVYPNIHEAKPKRNKNIKNLKLKIPEPRAKKFLVTKVKSPK